MLVLTRKSGESINISDEIKITVLEIKGNQVKLGIDAPGNVIIHREEIYQKIKEENLIAASLEIERFRKALSQIKKLTG